MAGSLPSALPELAGNVGRNETADEVGDVACESTDVPATADERASEALVERLVAELGERFGRGERPRVEELLARHPELAGRTEAAVELIYEEICLRQQHAAPAMPSELFRRFPQWRAQIEILLDCHRLLAGPPAPAYPQAGESLGDFQILAELGRGARGRVYLASQPALAGRAVVLKLAAADGQEHLSLARLQHTHIVPLYGVHEFPERRLRALCMPYFGGVTFEGLFAALQTCPPALRRGKQLSETLEQLAIGALRPAADEAPVCQLLTRLSYVEAICYLAALVADALYYAAQRGLVHLDLKPSNVLLAGDGQPMLLDFHLAQAPLPQGAPAPDWLGGTPAYMSPEQAAALDAVRAGGPVPTAVDGRADIYSLGLLLAEALAGELPPAEAQAAAGKPAPAVAQWLRQRNGQVPPGLADIVAKCTARDPNQRYGDASLLAADLRRHLADQPLSGVANRSLVERWRKWRRRRPYALAVAALVVVAAGAASLVFDRVRIERQAAERAQAAERSAAVAELHRVADQLRATFPSQGSTDHAARELEGHCRRFWLGRERITELLRPAGGDSQPGVAIDLLDLAVLWADLHVRLAADAERNAARREALAVLDEAEAMGGPSAVVDLERATHAAALGCDDVAQSARHRAAAAGPRTAWEHLALGRALLGAGQLDEALVHFDAALELEPQGLWANFYQGRCAYQRGRYGNAALAFTACAALAPDSAWCFYHRGLAFAKLGDAQHAQRDFDRARALDPALTLGTADPLPPAR